MIKGKRVLAVVPARGGSKGISLKNMRPILGVTLIARVGHLVGQISMIDRAVVSTDHPEIASAAQASGLDVPFCRPENLSGDFVSDHAVLIHALIEMERKDGVVYDIIVMLQPTSPMRRPKHVIDAIEKLNENKLDAVWTVSETDSKYHPLKQLLFENDTLRFYNAAGSNIVARQQLGKIYHRNGIAYAITRECILKHEYYTCKKWSGLVIDGPAISIDTVLDIEMVEWLIGKGGWLTGENHISS